MALLWVNKLPVWAKHKASVIQACQTVGIEIPRFCYHDKLLIAGNCRMCLIEVKNSMKPQASCALPFLPNLKIFTEGALIKKAQESVMELILLHHPLDCPVCDQGGECDLQEQSMHYGSDKGRFLFFKNSSGGSFWGGLVKTFMRRCIACTRCIRYIIETFGFKWVGASSRGENSKIEAFNDKALKTESSGGIIELCPVQCNIFYLIKCL